MKKLYFGIIILVLILLLTSCKDSEFVEDHHRDFFNKLCSIEGNRVIQSIYTDKARYNPGDEVKVTVSMKNNYKEDIKATIYLSVKYLGEEIDNSKSETFELKAEEDKNINMKWKTVDKDFKGYSIEAWLLFNKDKKFYDMKVVGVDVSSDWSKFPRYGYLSNFNMMTESTIEKTIARLNKYHINGLQFYDWQYKHEKPLKGTVDHPAPIWRDIANRMVHKKTVENYIKYAHQHNMMAMNYNLLFGAFIGYEQNGVKKEWGLFTDNQGEKQDYHPLPGSWASSKIFLMDPSNKEWQRYIYGREKEVFKVFDFDGWHVDQLGDRGRRFNSRGFPINLVFAYPEFLNNAKKALDTKLVFNAVGEFGQTLVASSTDVDFLYAEVWGGHQDYASLKRAIDNGLRYSDGEKNIVLAAYMNYDKADRKGNFNTPGVLLTDAVIFAAGGGHIELGDAGGMLSKEYFPHDNLTLTRELENQLIEYYDFSVIYQNLLRDNIKEIRRKVTSSDINLASGGKRDSVWYFVKAKDNKEMFHLINILGNDNLWRDTNGHKKEPPLEKDINIKYYLEDEVESVQFASPDFREGILQPLYFETDNDSNGQFIKIRIPGLKYWDMVVINKK